MDFLFRKLVVWQKAMELTRKVYGVVKHFPPEEKYTLSDQLRRAAVSIPSNIAEGNGRVGDKDYAHFLAIARGSLYETITQLDLAKSLGFISDTQEFELLADEINRMLTAMLRKYGVIPVGIAQENRSRSSECSGENVKNSTVDLDLASRPSPSPSPSTSSLDLPKL